MNKQSSLHLSSLIHFAVAPARFEPSSPTSRNCRHWSWTHSPFGVIKKREYDPSEQRASNKNESDFHERRSQSSYIPITVLFVSELGPNAQMLMVFSGRWNLQELHWELKYFGRNAMALGEEDDYECGRSKKHTLRNGFCSFGILRCRKCARLNDRLKHRAVLNLDWSLY